MKLFLGFCTGLILGTLFVEVSIVGMNEENGRCDSTNYETCKQL